MYAAVSASSAPIMLVPAAPTMSESPNILAIRVSNPPITVSNAANCNVTTVSSSADPSPISGDRAISTLVRMNSCSFSAASVFIPEASRTMPNNNLAFSA